MATNPADVPYPQSRIDLIQAARDAWRRRLIDLSRRNNLLFYRPLTNGTLELPISDQLSQFISDGVATEIGDLLPFEQTTATKIRAIARKGLENFEEKGLSTLYLAVGKCSWSTEDGGRDAFAPIILVPVNIEIKGQDIRSTKISITGKLEINPVLLHFLNEQLNVSIGADELLRTLSPRFAENGLDTDGDDIETDGAGIDLQAMLNLLADRGNRIPGFEAQPFAVIGNFSFQKLAMVKDLEKHSAELIANDIVAAIAGDAGARLGICTAQIEVDPNELDAVRPEDEFTVMDADSSQQSAIAGIVAGQSAVVHGPPGTGKSQTITNLVATLAARGKRILFVAEKRAALEVVMNRLKLVGLDHLVIDLHGAEQTPKKVMERVAGTLKMVREAMAPPTDRVHADYIDRRDRLNQHDARMHKVHLPTGLSIYEMQGRLLRLPTGIESPIRWRNADLNLITDARANEIRNLLTEAAGFERLFNRTDISPWCGVELSDARAAQNALDLFVRIGSEELSQFIEALAPIVKCAKFRSPSDLAEAGQVLEYLSQSNAILCTYKQDIFRDVRSLLSPIAPGCVGGLKGLLTRLTNSSVRQAYKNARKLRTAGKAPWKQILGELQKANDSLEFWQDWASKQALPVPVQGVDSCILLHQRVTTSLTEADTFYNLQLLCLPIQDLLAHVRAFASDTGTPYRVSRACEIERALTQLGVQRMVAEIRTLRRPANQWIPLFDFIWYCSTLDSVALNDPAVKSFIGATHDGYVQDFNKLDLKRLELAAARVRRAHAENAVAIMNKFPEQESVIRTEASKSSRHKPLRRIFSEASEVLTAVCPCWMASPLSVSQLIAATRIFDYVIFDEASQVLSEDAIPAIFRGKHVIVAGDNKQLPPTTFFAASDDDDDSESEATGYESLLDMMIPFVKGFHLNWHYRSHDESLVAFSNHYVYDDRLITFPGCGTETAISHIFVDHIPTADGQEESSGKEVETVVRLVLEHARKIPNLSLGVITMGIKHADRIQAVLDREINTNSVLADFFNTERKERFFIKNLERVQGDERDVIILSVGYAKDSAGNLPLKFGPILGAGGRRRLNVAVTRAKDKMTVVSSFRYSDIDSSKVRPGTGLELLKNFLEYAGSGGRHLLNGELTTVPMNPFELDVQEALSSQGIILVPQLGCSSFRIDFAACHPTEPGRYVLAIECDGASYHSSYTARDRDRLRQRQLELLGWTFHRIWSTDWFLRRDEEIKRAVHAFHRAVAKADQNGRYDSGTIAPRINRSQGTVQSLPQFDPSTMNRVRSPQKPPIELRRSIDEYSPAELRNLLQWIKSDGKLRTNDELADELFAALPFERRGSKIDAAIRGAIALG